MGNETMRWDADQSRAVARLRELLDRRGAPRKRHRGVYLHGRPGRGKTALMDRFYAEVASERKRRFHFHEFFARLHAARFESGSIEAAVDILLGDARLICFDEFHVHDIGDAMLIARLLDALFGRGVVLVVTSNYPPADLLPNPLFHQRFLPAIELILARMDVVPVDGPIDYRMLRAGGDSRTGFAAGRYLVTGRDPASARHPGAVDAPNPAVPVPIGTRRLTAVSADQGTLVIEFAALCGGPVSAADYVELARRFRRWEIRDVPLLREIPADRVTRLVNVVDVLYDADRELTVTARAELADTLEGVRGISDISRLRSRLCELSQ